MDSVPPNSPPSPCQPAQGSSEEPAPDLNSQRVTITGVTEPDLVPASDAPESASASHGSSSLWRYFERGNKMQRTNKFEANCLYCKHNENKLTRVRGEKRMMSAHLRNCHNASEHAKREGESISLELKMRRSSAPVRAFRPTEQAPTIALASGQQQHDSSSQLIPRHQIPFEQQVAQLKPGFQHDRTEQHSQLQLTQPTQSLQQRQFHSTDNSRDRMQSQPKFSDPTQQSPLAPEAHIQSTSIEGQNSLLHIAAGGASLGSCADDGSLTTTKKRRRQGTVALSSGQHVLNSALPISSKALEEAAVAAVSGLGPALSHETIQEIRNRQQLATTILQAVPSLHSHTHDATTIMHPHQPQSAQPTLTAGSPNFYDPTQVEEASQINGSMFLTNDGVRLYYEQKGSGLALILIHGWSGSSRYFVRNFDALATSFRVIRYDLRGHGRSEKPGQGFHISRFAVDLLNLMDHLQLSQVALLGCSLGCAVIWSFVELFGPQRISAALFVDQSPWQLYSSDGSWRLGSQSVFSAASLAHLSACLEQNPRGCHIGTVKACLTRAATPEEENFFVNESLKAQGWFLAKLMADHANSDWRATLPLVTCPALVIAGKCSKVFPSEGVAYAADIMPHAKLISFDQGSHWMYYEEADRFNSVVTAFLQSIVTTSAQ